MISLARDGNASGALTKCNQVPAPPQKDMYNHVNHDGTCWQCCEEFVVTLPFAA